MRVRGQGRGGRRCQRREVSGQDHRKHRESGFDAPTEWESLNRLTLDVLQRALLAARPMPSKVELMTSTVRLARDLMRHRLSDLVIGGVKILAAPWGAAPEQPGAE